MCCDDDPAQVRPNRPREPGMHVEVRTRPHDLYVDPPVWEASSFF